MPAIEETIDIRGPIEGVFHALTDPRRAPEWNPGIVEVTGLTYPIELGSSWTQVMTVMGRTLTVRCRVRRYEVPTYGELEVSGDQRGRVWTRCEARGAMTHVSQGIEFEPPAGGTFGSLAAGVIKGMMKRELVRSARRQRETLEREFGGVDGPGA